MIVDCMIPTRMAGRALPIRIWEGVNGVTSN